MKRYVRATGKDGDGDITALCNSGATWSPRSKSDAIFDIDYKVRDLIEAIPEEDWTPIPYWMDGAADVHTP